MIYFFVGENSFEISRAVGRLAESFSGTVERFDGNELELRQLPDILTGLSLFDDKRLVIIKGLAENKSLWERFGDWLDRMSDDITLVVIEPKPDKRTRTYKTLQKAAEVRTYQSWGERDTGAAAIWLAAEAKQRDLALTPALANLVVRRVGVDQWQLHFALEKLTVLEKIDQKTIEEIIDETPNEQVFGLFEAALRGDTAKVHAMAQTLMLREDAYRTFGLLTGQVMQLAALIYGPDKNVAKDFGVHPYALGKLKPLAATMTSNELARIVATFAAADDDMKSSGAEPWHLVERALLQVASHRQ